MDEECHEDAEAEGRVGVVGGVGDEAFGEFVEGNGDGSLKANREKGIGRYVVMVLRFNVLLLLHGRA